MGKNSEYDLEMEAGEEIESKMDLYERVDNYSKAIQLPSWSFVWDLVGSRRRLPFKTPYSTSER